jgi:hypothetical protein
MENDVIFDQLIDSLRRAEVLTRGLWAKGMSVAEANEWWVTPNAILDGIAPCWRWSSGFDEALVEVELAARAEAPSHI